MIKLITKFLSVFFAVIIAVSAVPVFSASAYSGRTDFGEVPLSAKNNFFQNDEFAFSEYIFIYRPRYDDYLFLAFRKNSTSQPDYSFLYIPDDRNKLHVSFRSSNGGTVSSTTRLLYFNADGSYRSYWHGDYTDGDFGLDVSEVSNDDVSLYVDSIIFSTLPVKYGRFSNGEFIGNTIYSLSQNQSFDIKNFFSWRVFSDSYDGNLYGPFPLVPSDMGNPTMQGFVQWLIDNNKFQELSSSFGISATVNNIGQLVGFWLSAQNGKLTLNEYFNALKTVVSINALSKAKNIYVWFTQQHELYKRSLITWVEDRPPASVTDTSGDYDEDGNFISSETTYLKFILGQIITFRNNVESFLKYLLDGEYIPSIANNFGTITGALGDLPKYIANAVNDKFKQSIQDLKDGIDSIVSAIDNIDISVSGGDTVTNNYYGDDDKDDFQATLAEFVPLYQSALAAKVPVLPQCEDLLNSCVDAMEQPFEGSVDYGSSSEHLSDSDSIIVSGLSAAFPDYSASYLDSASVAGAPVFTVNVGGVACPVVDFRIFAKHRSLIHAVISLIAWVTLALSVYKSLPSIIGGVSDLCDIVFLSPSVDDDFFDVNAIVEAEQSELASRRQIF